jgi:hypothetical protein
MVSTVSQRQRLEWALSDAKLKMDSAETGSLWILKPSVTNKGAVRCDYASFHALSVRL